MGCLIMGEIKDREHEKRGIEQKKTPTISFSILPKKDTNSTEHICSKSTKETSYTSLFGYTIRFPN